MAYRPVLCYFAEEYGCFLPCIKGLPESKVKSFGLIPLVVEISEQPSRAAEMTQQIRVLTALPEDPGSIPNTHMVAHS